MEVESHLSRHALPAVIEVDAAACVNCHACIQACPAKHCNDVSGEKVRIHADRCLGCGACVKACQHKARKLVDDTPAFFRDLAARVPMVAVVAPAVAAVFPQRWLNFNGWMKHLGVDAVFDVSFGAELTVKTYLDHVERNNPKAVIAQPCPAIVSYIEIYRPELLPYLAPADSPMLHTARMIRQFYQQYRSHRIAVISPCAAKKREFMDTGVVDYNVTFNQLIEELESRRQRMDSFPEVDYDNPPAERAVLFSTPGGLLKTAERWNPRIGDLTRKIEGPHCVYHYLDNLPRAIAQGHAPLLVDCLNCELGCNGGAGTPNQGASQDEIEHMVAQRSELMRRRHATEIEGQELTVHERVVGLVDQYWQPGLYKRSYRDRSSNNTVRRPGPAQVKVIYEEMEKHGKEDIMDCGACGYGRCEEMAVAIHNGLNRPDNCHLFKQRRIEQLLQNAKEMERITAAATQLSVAVEQMHSSIDEIARNATEATGQSQQSIVQARLAGEAMATLKQSGNAIGGLASTISGIAAQTRLLALNATIEAARAGDLGRGFSVVANEVKELARVTGEATQRISKEAQTIAQDTDRVEQMIGAFMGITQSVGDSQSAIAGATQEQASAVAEMSRQVHAIVEETQERVQRLAELNSHAGQHMAKAG
jgi:ferredoxin